VSWNTNQHGFIPGLSSLSLYGAIAAIAIAAALGVALKIQSSKLATVQAELFLCALQHKQALAAIERQNEEVTKLKQDSDSRLAAGRRALQEAELRGKDLLKERDRLKALRGKKPVGPCPSGEAVKKIRDGLK